jgi:hypothetical protein
VRQRGGNEDRWLFVLDASVEEGERELGSEGRRCGVLWGWCSPFIWGRGVPGRRCQVITVGVVAFKPLMSLQGVMRGLGGGGIMVGK